MNHAVDAVTTPQTDSRKHRTVAFVARSNPVAKRERPSPVRLAPRSLVLLGSMALLLSCISPKEYEDPGEVVRRAQLFIEDYTTRWLELSQAASQAEWRAQTEILEGNSTLDLQSNHASEAIAIFTGSQENVEKIRSFLDRRHLLTRLQIKQLEVMLYEAADNPASVPDLVKKRIKAETEQTRDLFGFDFRLEGRSITPNEIDAILRDSNDVEERLRVWRASKEVGRDLKPGLARLRDLRNHTVRALGYRSYFHYQVSAYGLEVEEMLGLLDELIENLRPLYRELHTYARYELASRYGVEEVPDLLPAHWLPNRWGQDWSSMVEIDGLDLNRTLATKKPSWLVEQAERFYVSLGFEELPDSFWDNSSLYPLPKGSPFKKNNHASAWHLDLDEDVRCLMSIVPNRTWYETTHHELGHIYYYLAYSNREVPPLLRDGANRAFHEAVGSQLGMAALQAPFLRHLGLVSSDVKIDALDALLQEALNHVVFVPFAAGTVTRFEYELYQALPMDRFNARWWEIVRRYQGIVPPSPRGEEYCDAASKTHLNNDPAQYYDYALSVILMFQFHDHIARTILDQDPRQTNYYGNEQIGRFLAKLLTPGASRDWRELLRETVGEDLSIEPMMRYFEPLYEALREKNQGRKHSLPEL